MCYTVILLRPHGGDVLAQGNGGGDDDSGGINTLPPSGGVSSEDVSPEYPDCPGYASHIADGYCDGDLNIAPCGWDGGDMRPSLFAKPIRDLLLHLKGCYLCLRRSFVVRVLAQHIDWRGSVLSRPVSPDGPNSE